MIATRFQKGVLLGCLAGIFAAGSIGAASRALAGGHVDRTGVLTLENSQFLTLRGDEGQAYTLVPSNTLAMNLGPQFIGSRPAILPTVESMHALGVPANVLASLSGISSIEVQDGATGDLDASTIVLLPNRNRTKLYLLAHPANTAAVHIRFVPSTVVFKRSAAVGDASANATTVTNAADASSANSGIYLASPGASFDEDASGESAWTGAVTAIGAAAGQNLIVLAYGATP